MKKLFRKAVICGGVLCSAACSAFAADGADVTADLVTTYITSGKTQVVTVLTAGAAIVGAFFVWGLIKRALRSSK